MLFWQRILQHLGLRPSSGNVRFEHTLLTELQALAERERRSPDEVAGDLLAGALRQRQSAEENLQRWRNLSPREQQVAALICLNYTNAEIAVRLGISLPTVKAHVRSVLRKFDLPRRGDLRQTLADWDFGGWA